MIPEEYRGREQTWLKHRVLSEYLVAWAHKLGSVGKKRRVKLWYVDCFSGPWKAKATDLTDTSVYLGLRALQEARRTWSERGAQVDVGAIFIEKSAAAFQELQKLLAREAHGIETHPILGTFGDSLGYVQERIGREAAFLLVDPTGWDGAAMDYIAPLVDHERRDVLVNVMFDHINRFKDDPRGFIRAQMKAFFGLGDSDIRPGLDEDELIALYRQRLREVCRLPYVADLAVPHPTVERTKFRLVVGGHHSKVIELFRDVEFKVVGAEAAAVRNEAKGRLRTERTGQFELALAGPKRDSTYASQSEEGLEKARRLVPRLLRDKGPMRYERVWPEILQLCHIRKSDLSRLLSVLQSERVVEVSGLGPRERTIKDDHEIRLGPAGGDSEPARE